MRALCLIAVKPGKVDPVVKVLKKKRKIVKQIMIVTGRADISVVLQGTLDEINSMVIDFKKIKRRFPPAAPTPKGECFPPAELGGRWFPFRG